MRTHASSSLPPFLKSAMAIFSSLVQFFSFSIFLTITTIAKTPCLDHQKALLLELKMQLVLCPSDSQKLARWNQTRDCCEWGGVECDSVGRVVGLHLDNAAISGGIEASSSALFRLRHLRELNLASNMFETPIPRGIGRLDSLTRLNLSDAGFVGQIPHEVSFLTRLVVLDLSTFMFYDPLGLKLEHPNLKMLVQNMHRLRELCLDGVNISAGAGDGGSEWDQALSSLPHLRILSLSYCGISGPFHPSLSKLHSLSILRLDGNDLFIKIPDFFANFTRLTSLSCFACSLRGPLPKLIFEMPSLRELDLSSNELLEGTIPEFNLSSRGTRVNSISMRDCGFGGVIPSMISNLTELVNLDLSLNFLTGSIPSFHMLEKLKSIDLGYNALNGSLSYSTFQGLTSLAYLTLQYNSLSGSIPHSLFGLPSLEKLFLDHNRFSGELMIDYFPTVNFTSSLDYIHLSNNFLSGSIPQCLFTLPALDILEMSNNQFSGKINHLSINSSTISWLDLSSNLLQGQIPDSFFHLRNLTNLILSNNLFTTLPTSNFSLDATLLYTLDLSSNIISGEIPSWIWEMGAPDVNLSCNLFEDLQRPFPVSTQLYSLDQLRGELPLLTKTAYHVDYSNNNFDTSIPHSFFDNNTSSYILVANNSLSGSIPTSLCNATSLEVVDLSFNRLSDSIPSCFVFEQIKVISLKGNNLNGLIPDRFTVNCSLQTFDLSSNNLGGKIPNSLSNCKELAVLNVGGNNFDDSFPCMLSSSLQVLVLLSNRFHGELRCHKSWPKLQIIDISSNNFSGSLLFINLLRGMMRRSDGSNLRPNYSSFDFLSADGSYRDEVTLTVKGQVEVKIVKIWPDFTCIDFSRNNFDGKIPVSIGNLSALYLLNLSHNALSGTIPRSLGNLTELGSLDFSFNKLRGSIPDEIGRLTFLSVLNLSYNHLVGKIPNGNQLQTFAADSFIGNGGLRGFPLDKSCSNVTGNGSKPQKVLTYEEIEWEYVSVAVGYVVGFGSLVWMLLFWRRFRKRYFEKIEQVAETILEGREGRRREARRRVLVRRYEVRRH